MQAEVNSSEEVEQVSEKTAKGWNGFVVFDFSKYGGENSEDKADHSG